MTATTHDVDDGQGDLAIAIPPAAKHVKLRLITRSQIHPDPDQPRKAADAELRNSIARNGLLQPITVRPHPTILTEWMIVDGERRWRSCEGVLEDLQCIVRTDQDELARRLATQLEANTAKPLTPLEEAHAFSQLLDDTGLSVGDLADFLGRAPSTVAERLNLLSLGPWLPLLESGELTMSHAVKVLLPLRNASDSAHEHAIAFMRKDWRFQNKGGGQGISLGDFERLMHQAYRPAMYPLTKTKTRHHRQPEFSTAQHDVECDCEGILFALDHSDAKRRCCGNPGWWKPLRRAALKAKAPKNGTTKGKARSEGKELFLPAGVASVQADFGRAPKGVVQLTDANGQWRFDEREYFDPADLAIDDKKLVRLRDRYASSSAWPIVATKDVAAVEQARVAWTNRVNSAIEKERTAFGTALRAHAAAYQIAGPGCPRILQLLDVRDNDDALDALVDVAEALGTPVPGSVFQGADWDVGPKLLKWAGGLDEHAAGRLLTGLAVHRGEQLVLPSIARERLERKLVEGIRKRSIPWKTKPPEAKAAPKVVADPKVKGTRIAPNGDLHMKPMYASPALSVIVGSKPLVRTDVTKKLWAYIKKHGLQDQQNRRMINSDDALRAVFGKPSVSMFEMTKIVNKHLAGTQSAAALIYTKTSKKTKAADTEIPLGKLSAETLAMPLDEEDDDDDGDRAGDRGVAGDDDQDLWDQADEEDELEEATG